MELSIGRAALIGVKIGVLPEAITGQGILHQIGQGTLLDAGGTLG